MWDIGNLGKERYCWCGEQESSEHVLDCEKVKEIIEKDSEKEWLVSERSEDLVKVTEFSKAYIEKREE